MFKQAIIPMIFLFLVSAFLTGCLDENSNTTNRIFISDDKFYTFTFPSGWKVVVNPNELNKEALKIHAGSEYSVDVLAYPGSMNNSKLSVCRRKVNPKVFAAYKEKQHERIMTLLKQDIQNDGAEVTSSEFVKTANGDPGFLLFVRKKISTTENRLAVFMIYTKKYELRLVLSQEASDKVFDEYRKMISTIDCTAAGVKNAEYNQREEMELRHDNPEFEEAGFFSGLWSGLVCPYRFALKILPVYEEDKQIRLTARYTNGFPYWAGFSIGLLFGVFIFFGINSALKK